MTWPDPRLTLAVFFSALVLSGCRFSGSEQAGSNPGSQPIVAGPSITTAPAPTSPSSSLTTPSAVQVPEPAVAPLAGVGLFLAWWYGRKRR